ncbi:MAG TPA: inositol monophosphatase [Blastocatellia bacterium]|nr:inositol monophosphatase [Blastocatellia bacterium]
MNGSVAELLEPLLRLHEEIRQAVVAACERHAPEELADIAEDDVGDTIYVVDRVGEDVLVDFLEREIATRAPIVLIAEGLAAGRMILPEGADEADARWRIIVDPIDGTRGLMYQKRSAWILTGVAANRGPETDLQDIVLAIQTEIPLVKQHLSDQVWAIRGQGVSARRWNRLTGRSEPLRLRPSRARTIAHGFAQISRFFPGARALLAALDDEIAEAAVGPVQPGKALCFEDQYISTGGQLYELMIGHDRFTADLRPVVDRSPSRSICCHPYDICTELIARELGVIITDVQGNPLRAPLAVEPDIAWIGYANEHIRAEIEPLLQAALRRRGFLPEER